MEDIYEMDLKARKQKVKEELEKKNLTLDKIIELLSYDNTNEELISRYIINFFISCYFLFLLELLGIHLL